MARPAELTTGSRPNWLSCSGQDRRPHRPEHKKASCEAWPHPDVFLGCIEDKSQTEGSGWRDRNPKPRDGTKNSDIPNLEVIRLGVHCPLCRPPQIILNALRAPSPPVSLQSQSASPTFLIVTSVTLEPRPLAPPTSLPPEPESLHTCARPICSAPPTNATLTPSGHIRHHAYFSARATLGMLSAPIKLPLAHLYLFCLLCASTPQPPLPEEIK